MKTLNQILTFIKNWLGLPYYWYIIKYKMSDESLEMFLSMCDELKFNNKLNIPFKIANKWAVNKLSKSKINTL